MFTLDHQYVFPVAGVDEAGRGPLAGPVVASAVILDPTHSIPGIKDSKKLTEKNRMSLYELITKKALWSVGIVYQDEIDKINILNATKKACLIAVNNLPILPTTILVDGNMRFSNPHFISIIKGDQLSYAIGAASIVAKVTRDRLMREYAKEFPQYHWHKNYGYGTKGHMQAMRLYGLTPYHRLSFKVKCSL